MASEQSVKPHPNETENNVSDQTLLLLFDEIVRNAEALEEGSAAEQFLVFSGFQEFYRTRWKKAENESARLKFELQDRLKDVKKMKVKLDQARWLIAAETSRLKSVEREKEELSEKLKHLKILIIPI